MKYIWDLQLKAIKLDEIHQIRFKLMERHVNGLEESTK